MVTPLLALVVAVATAGPAPSPSPDPCGGSSSNLLATLNRPTIGFSACAVKAHESLWEIGYSKQSQNVDSGSADYPQGFIRFGAAPRIELDFIGPAYRVQRQNGMVQRGFLDSGLGLKYEFYQSAADVAAFDFLYLAPTGSAAFTAGAPVETLNFDYGHSLSPASGFALTVGAQSSFASDFGGRSSRFFSTLPSVVFTTQTNPSTQFYAEAYGQAPLRPDGGALFGLDGGVQYLLTPSVEIDAEAGRTVTDISSGHYYGFGLGLRF